MAAVQWGSGDFAADAALKERALQQARRLGQAETTYFAVRAILSNGQAAKHWPGRVRLAEEFCREPPPGVNTGTIAPVLADGGLTLWGAGQAAAAEAAWSLLTQLATRTQDPPFPDAGEARREYSRCGPG